MHKEQGVGWAVRCRHSAAHRGRRLHVGDFAHACGQGAAADALGLAGVIIERGVGDCGRAETALAFLNCPVTSWR